MLDETKRKAVVLDYFKRVNAGDVEAICELFSPEARIEDPIGAEAVVGEEAVRAYFKRLVEEYQTQDSPGDPTGSQDNSHIAVPFKAVITNPVAPGGGRLAVNVVCVFGFAADGLIESLVAYWGMTDISPA
jgi:steroid Delta-isomerase